MSQPRGVLRQKLEQGEFQHARRSPSSPLAELVEHYWHVSWDLRGLPAQTQETLPHPNVQFVIEPGLTAIYGVHTERYTRKLQGHGQVFGIKFKAGGFFPFYGKAVSALLDASMDPVAIFGNAAMPFQLEVFASHDIDAMADCAEQLLISHLPPEDPQVTRVSTLVAAIASDHTITTVDQAASLAGLGKRNLQRLFSQYVGATPKWVINRYRLHEAVAQLQAGTNLAWKELALELGYFDQAHFIRDFRKLIGRSPTEYARRESGS